MKKHLIAGILAAGLVVGGLAGGTGIVLGAGAGTAATTTSKGAALKTVTLDVPGMYCSMCPKMVGMALKRVPGVADVKASLETKTAVVTFDPAQASVDDLIAAAASIGYVAKLREDAGSAEAGS